METLEHKCVLADKCKHAGKEGICNITCYPYVVAHGTEHGGFFGASGIPQKYKASFLNNLPIKAENPEAYAVAQAYIKDSIGFVSRGVGLFLYSVPNALNKLGTGVGKTQTATAIGNEYLKARIIQHAKGEKKITDQPTLFVRVAEFQNTYNKQFRGGFEEQEAAAAKFSRMVDRMQKAELLILDDISLRSATEALTNVLYEILDERYISEKPVILTSNFPIEKIGEILNPQIQSRIEGMTEAIAFKGKDYRKGGIL
jgi:DNA replication protein DnaC